MDLRGFWLETFSNGVGPKIVVICELNANGKTFRSFDHSVYFLSSPFVIHWKYSCKERFMSLTNPFDLSWVMGCSKLMFILERWHNVMISLSKISVPLSVTKISDSSNFAIQCL